jgi:hypothetical protein
LEEYSIIESKFEFINRIWSQGLKLEGGWHLLTVKFFETRIFLKAKRNTLMSEIYGRIGRLLNIDPRLLFNVFVQI